ncbi:SpoIIE family protein phosphatase [Streptomyces sp. NRRL B-1677]|uniref:Serine/threonine-protein phosphatase n=1 Tax=Streptomyces klenkii TaxID=1420899 RepID=A0A3B0AYE5_9ACTN|nr:MULTISPECIES: PP2C family protein-serine/threonine phosphatase [Streptomyces]MBF6050073.1 SpoIIE family protein phosphatase [Streptomyces sp. NRRL B-1677]RKN64967.1 serine/threonine-protein phosphatase [Streptomyces klenkii]
MSSRRLPFALVLAYLGAIVAVDLMTPSNLRLDVFAALAPMTAAAVCTYRQTVFVGVLDFCLMVAHHGVVNGEVPVNRVGSFVGNALMVGASIAVARLRRDAESLLERVRATGEAAQRALLRPLPLRTRSVVVDGFYVSSQREALVGGDLYEVVDTPYGTRVLIGDVRGKGLGTLGAGAAVLTAFREAAYHRRDLEGGVVAMEQGLYRYHRSAEYQARLLPERHAGRPEDVRMRAAEEFVTALAFGTEEGPGDPGVNGHVPVVFVDCGHLAPFLIGPDGGVRELEPADAGLPLGLGDLAAVPRTVQRVALPPGCRVLACTDGVTEARSPDGGFYPLAERLGAWAALPTPQLLGRLRADLDAHTGGRLQDDVAVLVMERAAEYHGAAAGEGEEAAGAPAP